MNEFDTKIKPTWCPGCGNYGVFTAVKKAFKKMALTPDEVAVFYDVGCSSNWADFMNTYAFHGLHGRGLPPAAGASFANHKIPILTIIGDGGAYGEGLNHFISACRANYNITMLVTNNQLYSLTTGQMSPTTLKGRETKSTPKGALQKEFNPLTNAIVNHCSFVSRSFSNDVAHLTDLIIKAVKHKGFSLIDVLQPCITLNKQQPIKWYMDRIYKLEDVGYTYIKALELAKQQPEKLPIGIFYKEKRQPYSKQLPQLEKTALVEQSIENINIEELVKELI
jgi:2-oxoglutarate ferredoxin oxidoreductase subunit beta